MRIAIAGAGAVAKYIVEEALKASCQVTVLSRSHKDWFAKKDVTYVVTDYSVGQLVKQLDNCDSLVSCISDSTMVNVQVHLDLLEACKRSSKCKTFIPAEYAGNLDDYPDQPMFDRDSHMPIRDELRAQKDIKWTLINLGWFSDYFIPSENRYINDMGDYWPIDLENRTILVAGTGNEPITFTSARDMAKAIILLMSHPEWEEYTYVCGETTSWNKIAKNLGKDFTIKRKSLADIVDTLVKKESEDAVFHAYIELYSASGASGLPPAKVDMHRKTFFPSMKFKSIEQVIQEAKSFRNKII
jgi:putative NADH-flavin reductase